MLAVLLALAAAAGYALRIIGLSLAAASVALIAASGTG
jgi:hypothetical protein